MGNLLFTSLLMIAVPVGAVALAGAIWILVHLGLGAAGLLALSGVGGVWLMGYELDRQHREITEDAGHGL